MAEKKPKFDPKKPFEVVEDPRPAPKAEAPKFDPTRPFEVVEEGDPGLFDSALETAIKAGKFIDSYTGAPVREAVGTLQDGKGVLEAGKAMLSQFGADPSTAPTSTEIAERARIPEFRYSDYLRRAPVVGPALAERVQETPADVSLRDLGLDVAMDLTNVVPGAAALKVTERGAKAAAKGASMAGKGAKAVAGAVAPKTTEVATQTAKGLVDSVRGFARNLKPTLRPQYAQDVELAMRHGIDPEYLSSAVKYGPDSYLSKAERVRAQSPTGADRLARHREGLNQVRRAADDEIRRMAGGADPLDPQGAGELLRQGYNDSVTRFFDQIDVTYDTIPQLFPGARVGAKSAQGALSKLNGIRRRAIALAKRGPTPDTRAQGAILLEDLDVIENTLREGSYKQVLEELRLLGENAFKHNSGVLKPITQNRRDAYFALRDALTDTVEELGNKEIADTLRKNNKAISQFMEKTGEVSDLITDSSVAPERVFNQLVASGDSRKIQILKSILPPEVLGRLKASYLENLKILDKDEGFSFARLNSTLRNNDKARRVIQNLFEPDELAEFQSLIQLGDDFGPPILNPSGTFVSQQYSGLWETIQKEATNEGFINAVKAAGEDPREIEKMVRGMREGTVPPAAPPAPAAAPKPVYRPSKKELTARALRAASAEAGRTTNVPITAEMEQDVKDEIARRRDIPNTEKARQIDHINRYGEVLDAEPLLGPGEQVAPPSPEPQRPAAPPLREVNDFIKSRRPEPY